MTEAEHRSRGIALGLERELLGLYTELQCHQSDNASRQKLDILIGILIQEHEEAWQEAWQEPGGYWHSESE